MRTLNFIYFQTQWAAREFIAELLHDLAEWIDN